MLSTALYKCMVMHNRLAPKQHRFVYNVFMFWLDIDTLAQTADKYALFSLSRPGIFSFRHTDHFKYPARDDRNTWTVREKLNGWLTEQGISEMPHQVFLLTHVRMFGYVFNPVSFYFCYDEQGRCQYVVTEISNTFGEMKMFLVQQHDDGSFLQEDRKYFYVSPFTDMDDSLVFRYKLPDAHLNLRIDTHDSAGNRFFISTLTGERKTLSDVRLLWYVVRFPFITLQVISAIHWHAFKLWLKRIPWHRKADDPELQRNIMNDPVDIVLPKK